MKQAFPRRYEINKAVKEMIEATGYNEGFVRNIIWWRARHGLSIQINRVRIDLG